MLNSRLFSTVLFILAIFSLVYGLMYFYKKDNTNIIYTTYGSVDLGKVYAEKVRLSVEIKGFIDSSDKFQELAEAPFVDSMTDIDKTMEEHFKVLNSLKNKAERITYQDASPKVDMKVKLITQIHYNSEHYNVQPFVLTIAENEYDLKKNQGLRHSINKAVQVNFASNKSKVVQSLFLTDPVKFGLIEEKQ